MRQINMVVWVLLVFIALQGAAVVSAKGTPGVKFTPHNLSATAPVEMYQTDETEICVFCHTPHGGSLSGPLWNRPDTTTSYTQYETSTPALSDTRIVRDESLMCLSCHDGTLSVNSVLNLPTWRVREWPENPDIWNEYFWQYDVMIPEAVGGQGANLGSDLSNDHPISFSYFDVREYYSGTLNKPNEFHDPLDAKADGVRFFGSDTELFVECSSCHDPHVNYIAQPQYAPFLNMSNSGSALCLACHNK